MKKRLDVLLTELNPELTRSKAQTIIMSGVVYVNNQKETKAGSMFPEDAVVEVRGETLRYVSRGGLKLEKAMECFPVSPSGKICMDIGSSTGGFTDCMLQNGAVKVYSVDVGKGLLHYKLRNDPRVVVMEKTNIRYLKPEEVPEKINFASVDVSFISLTLILPAALELLDEHKEMVMLIKPQFEAGREKVGKKGVVRDPAVHEEVIEKIYDFVDSQGLKIHGLDFSPVKGPEGNIEYLIYINADGDESISKDCISSVVKAAHDKLDK
jgi:23S rRNA (cytidine1920-2'-O)/16S rRNA (cytidine1409-2'-O)-methyltransferase